MADEWTSPNLERCQHDPSGLLMVMAGILENLNIGFTEGLDDDGFVTLAWEPSEALDAVGREGAATPYSVSHEKQRGWFCPDA